MWQQMADSETKWRGSIRQKEAKVTTLIGEKEGMEKELQKLKSQVQHTKNSQNHVLSHGNEGLWASTFSLCVCVAMTF